MTKHLNEERWRISTDPYLLTWLREHGYLSDRKARLFAAACARSLSHLYWSYEEYHRAVLVAEQYADGMVGDEALCEAREWFRGDWRGISNYRTQAALATLSQDAMAAAYTARHYSVGLKYRYEIVEGRWKRKPNVSGRMANRADISEQCEWLRCMAGNPFGPLPSLNPLLITPRVRDLAIAVYEERVMPQGNFDSEKLLALADALEEAGCQDQVVLGHLNEPGAVHVRGCHIIDLLLGKS